MWYDDWNKIATSYYNVSDNTGEGQEEDNNLIYAFKIDQKNPEYTQRNEPDKK